MSGTAVNPEPATEPTSVSSRSILSRVIPKLSRSDDLFSEQWVAVPLPPSEFPGYKGDRLACANCGEGINYDRFVERGGHRLCHACANPDERYYQPL